MRVRALNFPTPALNQTRSQHKAHLKVTQTHLTRASRPGGGNTRAKGEGQRTAAKGKRGACNANATENAVGKDKKKDGRRAAGLRKRKDRGKRGSTASGMQGKASAGLGPKRLTTNPARRRGQGEPRGTRRGGGARRFLVG